MKKIFILLSICFVASNAVLADSGNKLLDTSEAVTVAVETFKEENPSTVTDRFLSLAALPSEHGVTVTFKLKERNPISYGCHRHGDLEPFECHEL